MDSEDPIEVSWAAVEARWNEDQAHRSFITLASTLGRLADAGAKYRVVRDTDPEREEDARRRIDQLFAQAAQGLRVVHTETHTLVRARRVLSISIMLALGALALLTLLLQ